MAFYVAGSMPYDEFLQHQSFSDDVKGSVAKARKSISFDIDRQTRELIASRKDLEEMNIRVRERERAVDAMERVSDTLSIGFSGVDRRLSAIHDDLGEISGQLDGIHSAISDLTLCLRTGFAETIYALGRANDQLSELVQLAKTQSKTRAYEYFEDARDAFRRRLYAESVEYLDKAIQGDHTSTGYKLEWRFHHLLGTIRLGFVGGDTDLIDLAAAEQAFLNAGRYAQADDPQQAADEYLLAGWAAYCQSDFETALKHTEATLRLKPRSADARYQAAKISMASGNVVPGLKYLREAIDAETLYALQAAGDGDFTRHDDAFTRFMDALRNRDAQKAQKAIAEAEDLLGGLRKPFSSGPNDSLKRAKEAHAQNTIVGHRSAAALAAEAMALAPAAYEKQKYNDEANALRNSALETLAKLEAATDAAQRTIDRTAANEESAALAVEPEFTRLRSRISRIRNLLSSKEIDNIDKGRKGLDALMPIPHLLLQLVEARIGFDNADSRFRRMHNKWHIEESAEPNKNLSLLLAGVGALIISFVVSTIDIDKLLLDAGAQIPRGGNSPLPVVFGVLSGCVAFFILVFGCHGLQSLELDYRKNRAKRKLAGPSEQREIAASKKHVVESELADRWRRLEVLDKFPVFANTNPMFKDIPAVKIKNYAISKMILDEVPEELARQYGVIPFALTGDLLTLAMVDPGNDLAVEDISQFTGYRIERMQADPSELKQALDRYYPKSR